MPAAAMAPEAQGCTILGAWVKRRMDQTAGLSPGAAPPRSVRCPKQAPAAWLVGAARRLQRQHAGWRQL